MPPPEFSYYPLRFRFRALDPVHFPAGKSGNVLRGAFGMLFREVATDETYARIFQPKIIAGEGPSGLADPPRPFVFRASHLDGRSIPVNAEFHFDLNLFDLRHPSIPEDVRAFERVAKEGLGPGRGRAELLTVTTQDGAVDLHPCSVSLAPSTPATRIRVEFLTPTELKGGKQLLDRPGFGVLFARIRDRISTLKAIYADGPLDVDFKELGHRAAAVEMTHCDVHHVSAQRLSTRTGQRHPLGGFTGTAEYSGDLAEFLPYLLAASATGVGRQTTWGKGEIRTLVLSC